MYGEMMEKLKNTSLDVTGKLLYEHQPQFHPELRNKTWKKIRIIFIVALFLSLLLFLFYPDAVILFVILFMISGIIVSSLDWDEGSERFRIFENGFAANIKKRPKNPNLIWEWEIGQRFVKYDEIIHIYKIYPFKPKSSLANLDIVRIDISPKEKRYSCIINMFQIDVVLNKLISQIKKKKIKVEIDDNLLTLQR